MRNRPKVHLLSIHQGRGQTPILARKLLELELLRACQVPDKKYYFLKSLVELGSGPWPCGCVTDNQVDTIIMY